jgi:tRNA threonylcarbamoyladenosine biosynthesis protein TsaE
MNPIKISFRFSQLSELDSVAKQLLKLGRSTPVWLFNGSMGVGKTTLIKKLCDQLQVTSTVQSPTFAIVNEYETTHQKVVYHFDFYRIKNENEAYDIGVEEYLYSGDYCFIEWPEKIESLWPEHYFNIDIQQKEGGERVLHAEIVNLTKAGADS